MNIMFIFVLWCIMHGSERTHRYCEKSQSICQNKINFFWRELLQYLHGQLNLIELPWLASYGENHWVFGINQIQNLFLLLTSCATWGITSPFGDSMPLCQTLSIVINWSYRNFKLTHEISFWKCYYGFFYTTKSKIYIIHFCFKYSILSSYLFPRATFLQSRY